MTTHHYAIDKSLSVNDVRFHYRDWGGHGWPMLLLHGLASTGHIWDLVSPLLVEDARIVALDQRGHGQSEKPDGDYTFQTIAADARAVLASLQMERPVIVGHSWGANVGLWLAANYPDDVSGLVMVDGGLMSMNQQASWEETWERLKPPDLDGTHIEEFRQIITVHSPQGLITPAVEAAILANFEIDADQRIHPRLPLDYHQRILRAIWEMRAENLFEKVTCPTLLLLARWKDKDDAEHLKRKEAAAERAQEGIADSEVFWLEDSIHDVPLQRPHLVAEQIRRFLKDRL